MYVQLEPSFERESRGMYATHYIVDYEGDYVPQNQSFYQRQLQPVFVAPAARDPAYLWYHQNHQILVPPPPPPPQRRPKDVAEQHVAQVLCGLRQDMTQNAAERNEVRDEKALDKIPRDVAREYLHHGAPASFVLALHAMLSNESSRLVHLSPDGDLVVCDSAQLENSGILSRYYKHNNAKSFQRQLYNFGFVRSSNRKHKCKTTAKIKAVTTHPNNQSSSAKKVASTSPASSSNFLVSAEDSFYRNDAIPGKKRPRSCDGVLQEGHCRRPFRGGIDAGGELAPTVRQALCLVQV